MATNEPIERWITDPENFPPQLPQGVTRGRFGDTGLYYAHEVTYPDGKTVTTWYKRRSGGGPDGGDAPVGEPVVGLNTVVRDAKVKADAELAQASQRTITREGHTWQFNPATNKYDIDLGASAAPPTAAEEATKQAQAQVAQSQAGNAASLDAERAWHEQQGHGRLTHAEYATQQRQAQQDQLALAAAQRADAAATKPNITYREVKQRDGSTRVIQVQVDPITGAESVNPSAIPGAPAPPPNVATVNGRQGTWERDESGNVVFREAQGPQTPTYTYPELKLAYGNIASELGAIQRDIYSRVGTGPGKITKQEADALFLPIHQQAETRVSELNNIVSTQRSLFQADQDWAQAQQQTANTRLGAANDMSRLAFSLGQQADKMAPGTGAVAAHAIWDTLGAQRDFARSLGGLEDVQRPSLPGYLQAAADARPDAPFGTGSPLGSGWMAPRGQAVADANARSTPAFGATIGNILGGGGAGPGVAPPAAPAQLPLAPPPGMGPQPSALPLAPPSATGPLPQPPVRDDWAQPQGYHQQSASQQFPGTPINIYVGAPGQQQMPPPPPPQPPMPPPQPPMQPMQPPQPPMEQQGMQGMPPSPQGYLQQAAQPPRPSLRDAQHDTASDLIAAGFSPGAIEDVWKRKTGRGLFGRGSDGDESNRRPFPAQMPSGMGGYG